MTCTTCHQTAYYNGYSLTGEQFICPDGHITWQYDDDDDQDTVAMALAGHTAAAIELILGAS